MPTKLIDIPEKDISFANWLIILLRAFGFWRRETDHKTTYLVYSAFYNLHILAFGTLLVIYLLFCVKNFSEFMDSLCYTLPFIALLIKNCNFLFQNREIRELYRMMKKFKLHVIDGDYWERTFLQKRMNSLKNIIKIYYPTAWVTIILLFAGCLITSKLFLAWYPIDWQQSRAKFHILWFHQAVTILISGTNNITVDLLPIFIMWMIIVQMEVLGRRLKYLGQSKSDQENKKKLIDIIKCHQDILEAVDRCQDLFSIPFFGQVAISNIGICAVVFEISIESPSDDYFRYIGLIGLSLVYILQIFIPCYIGQQIILKSEALLFDLYDSNWEFVPSKKYRVLVTLFMERLKRPNEIYVGKMFPLSMMTFSSIVNVTYRLFTLLQNVN